MTPHRTDDRTSRPELPPRPQLVARSRWPAMILVGLLLLPLAMITIPTFATSHASTSPVSGAGPSPTASRDLTLSALGALTPSPPAVLTHSVVGPTGPGSVASAIAYDAVDGYVVFVSPNWTGPNGSVWGATINTWTYLHGNWTELNLTGAPPNRQAPAMVYDPSDGYVVLFGGSVYHTHGNPGYLNDTWTFSHGTWTNRTSTGTAAPSPREQAFLTWDAADRSAFLHGGFGSASGIFENLTDSWSYVGGAWTNQTTGVAPPGEGTMVYDGADGYVLYFGGAYSAAGAGNSQETWEYHAGNWTNVTGSVTGAPSPRSGAVSAFDPVVDKVVLFGGCCAKAPPGYPFWLPFGDVWTYAAGAWSEVASETALGNRSLTLAVYDPDENGTLLFGGWAAGITYSDVWVIHLGSGTITPAILQAAPALQWSETPLPLGTPVTLSTLGVFGAAGTTFAYTGLPAGCAGVNAAIVTCTPTVTGSFPVWVFVNATTLGHAKTSAVLDVVPVTRLPTGGSGGSGGGGALPWYDSTFAGGLLVGAVLTVGVGGVLVYRDRRRAHARDELVARLKELPRGPTNGQGPDTDSLER
ncbi:MAG: hypothetical protein L3K17_01805 [Thermoplasmata archaeon]|nr:hypothetical protein [Thermoplasmata archaeon]